jgi:hypothetical protein
MLQRTWLLGLALAAAAAGCNRSSGVCVGAHCPAAVPVRVVDDGEPGGKLRAGEYRFVVSTDYAEKAWTCAVPAEDCALDFFTDFEDGEDSGTLTVVGRSGETGLELEVLETRGNVWSGPARFVVQVERDGALVVEESFEPRYEDRPASDACVVCRMPRGPDLVVHVPG